MENLEGAALASLPPVRRETVTRFQMRVTNDDRNNIARLAERLGTTGSEAVRWAVTLALRSVEQPQ